MIQEFHISITPVGQDCYWLRTEAVAAGVPLAETQVTWPVDRWLKQAETLFQDPLQALLTNPSLGAPLTPGQEPAWIQLGQSLYQNLFQDRIRDSWLAAQGVAQNRRQTLRLRLGFKDSRLQRLPWELLYGDDRPLASGIDVSLCRYYQALGAADLSAMPLLPNRAEPINVLVVISAPDDQERLALTNEVQSLVEDLQLRAGNQASNAAQNGDGHLPIDLKLTILQQPGRPELAQALEQGQFQVLHYAGHSDISETGGELYLVNRQTGLTDGLSGEDLAGLLVNNGIRLAVFNSCRGAYTPADDAETGWREQNLVQALVNRGVPGVIAMAERIPDDVAVTFTRLLYRNLQQGYSIDLCLSRVRQGLISAYRSDQPFWMLPILYLRPDFDGYLYANPDRAESGPQALSAPVEGSLEPPDYSSDPDISGLAEEILSGHITASLPDLGSSDADRLTAAPSESQPLPHVFNQAASVDAATASVTDLIGALEQTHHAGEQAEAATVTSLVEQLSQLDGPDVMADEPLTAPASKEENLLPDWATPSTDLKGKLPADPDATGKTYYVGSASPAPPKNEPSNPQPMAAKPWSRSRSLPGNLAIWIGLGGFSLLAALALAITALSRLGNDTAPALVVEPPARQESPASGIVGRDSAVMTAALGAIAEDKPATAAKFINQLLDQRDMEAAAGVISAASPELLIEPEIAFVRGRLVWQQAVTGLEAGGTVHDAQRYWNTAVEADPDFLEAWVALGFAHYQLGDFDAAQAAWQEAVDLDRDLLRDNDPAGQRRFTSEFTIDAYAGLAMVNLKLSELNPLERQQEQHLQQAEAYFSQAITTAPSLLDPQALALNWLWSPDLIKSWQTTVDRLSILSDPLISE